MVSTIIASLTINLLFEEIGIENPMDALAHRSNIFYVSTLSRERLILTFLREHYDKRYTSKRVGRVDKYPVWEFYIAD